MPHHAARKGKRGARALAVLQPTWGARVARGVGRYGVRDGDALLCVVFLADGEK